MDFDRLRAFVWILEEGSFSAAASSAHPTGGDPDVANPRRPDRRRAGRAPCQTAAPDRHWRPRAAISSRDSDRRGPAHERLDSGSRQTLPVGISRRVMWHLRDPRFVQPVSPLSETDFMVRSGWSPRLYRRFARGEFDCAVLLMPAEWTPESPCGIDVVRREPLVILAPPVRAWRQRRQSAWLISGTVRGC
jgi:hypothetical protein